MAMPPPHCAPPPHAAPVDPEEATDALLRDLGSQAGGLGNREAERRLSQHGRNEIRRLDRTRHVRDLARQLVDPLAMLLWLAAAFSVVEGGIAIADPTGAGTPLGATYIAVFPLIVWGTDDGRRWAVRRREPHVVRA